MPPRHDDCVCDSADLFAAAPPSLEGAPQLTAEEQALRQVLDEPGREPNEIRAMYLLEPLGERGIDEWIAAAGPS